MWMISAGLEAGEDSYCDLVGESVGLAGDDGTETLSQAGDLRADSYGVFGVAVQRNAEIRCVDSVPGVLCEHSQDLGVAGGQSARPGDVATNGRSRRVAQVEFEFYVRIDLVRAEDPAVAERFRDCQAEPGYEYGGLR